MKSKCMICYLDQVIRSSSSYHQVQVQVQVQVTI